jgi:uncharacterized protein YheU (UPF0270 family)
VSTPTVIEVPHCALSPEALRGVIEEFVTRAGTDYGAQERPIEERRSLWRTAVQDRTSENGNYVNSPE